MDGRLIVTGAANLRNGKALTLIKDPHGADPGGAPAYHLPPGTPPALPAARGAGGMNRQIFTFLLVGDRLRGVVCGRCDEIDPPTLDRSIVARSCRTRCSPPFSGTVS